MQNKAIKIALIVLVIANAMMFLALTVNQSSAGGGQERVLVTHYNAQGQEVWTKCMPVPSLNGHLNGHAHGEKDVVHGPCEESQEPTIVSTNTEVISTATQQNTATVTAEERKVTICHATGSDSNPWIEITIAWSAWINGHENQHQHDGIFDFIVDGDNPCPPTQPTATVTNTATIVIPSATATVSLTPTFTPEDPRFNICHVTPGNTHVLRNMPASSLNGHFNANGTPRAGHLSDFLIPPIPAGYENYPTGSEEECVDVPIATATATNTNVPTATATVTTTATNTATVTPTASNTPTDSPSITPTPTGTPEIENPVCEGIQISITGELSVSIEVLIRYNGVDESNVTIGGNWGDGNYFSSAQASHVYADYGDYVLYAILIYGDNVVSTCRQEVSFSESVTETPSPTPSPTPTMTPTLVTETPEPEEEEVVVAPQAVSQCIPQEWIVFDELEDGRWNVELYEVEDDQDLNVTLVTTMTESLVGDYRNASVRAEKCIWAVEVYREVNGQTQVDVEIRTIGTDGGTLIATIPNSVQPEMAPQGDFVTVKDRETGTLINYTNNGKFVNDTEAVGINPDSRGGFIAYQDENRSIAFVSENGDLGCSIDPSLTNLIGNTRLNWKPDMSGIYYRTNDGFEFYEFETGEITEYRVTGGVANVSLDPDNSGQISIKRSFDAEVASNPQLEDLTVLAENVFGFRSDWSDPDALAATDAEIDAFVNWCQSHDVDKDSAKAPSTSLIVVEVSTGEGWGQVALAAANQMGIEGIESSLWGPDGVINIWRVAEGNQLPILGTGQQQVPQGLIQAINAASK